VVMVVALVVVVVVVVAVVVAGLAGWRIIRAPQRLFFFPLRR
jgi:hypothetical protein